MRRRRHQSLNSIRKSRASEPAKVRGSTRSREVVIVHRLNSPLPPVPNVVVESLLATAWLTRRHGGTISCSLRASRVPRAKSFRTSVSSVSATQKRHDISRNSDLIFSEKSLIVRASTFLPTSLIPESNLQFREEFAFIRTGRVNVEDEGGLRRESGVERRFR